MPLGLDAWKSKLHACSPPENRRSVEVLWKFYRSGSAQSE